MAKLIITFLIIVIILGCDSKTVESEQPNFLILMADDAGYRDFGCYGNESISTPNIDNLAQAGLKFNKAFLTTSQCSPSRISILSVNDPYATGAEDLHMPLPEGELLVTSFLKEKNYELLLFQVVLADGF